MLRELLRLTLVPALLFPLAPAFAAVECPLNSDGAFPWTSPSEEERLGHCGWKIPAHHERPALNYSVVDFADALLLRGPPDNRDGSGRTAAFESFLGTVVVNWEHELEPRFNVLRETRAAFSALERVTRTPGLSWLAVSAGHGWNVLAKASAPRHLHHRLHRASACYHAFAGPPADIAVYFRPEARCDLNSGASMRDLRLTLLHEIAHGVEFRLMGDGFSRRERWHGEGMALWFEIEAAAVLYPASAKAMRRALHEEARGVYEQAWSPALFAGTRADYVRSYARFAALTARFGADGLRRSYARMAREGSRFAEAVERELGWDEMIWRTEVLAWGAGSSSVRRSRSR